MFASDRDTPGNHDIWIADANGQTNLVNLTPDTDGSDEIEPHLGSATPTASNYVVFRSNRDEPTYEIYRVRKNDPTDLQRLTFNTVPDQDPQWCGGVIVFVRDILNTAACYGDCEPPNCPKNPGTDFQIYEIGANGDLPGSPAKELTCLNNVNPGSCPTGVPGAGTASPFSTRLFYKPTCHLSTNFEGEPQQQVAFSYYIPSTYSKYKIGRAPLCSSGCCVDQSSDIMTLTASAQDNDYPSWNLLGDTIFFSSNRPSPNAGQYQSTTDLEIYALEAEWGEPGPPDGDPAPALQLTDNEQTFEDEDPYVGQVKGP